MMDSIFFSVRNVPVKLCVCVCECGWCVSCACVYVLCMCVCFVYVCVFYVCVCALVHACGVCMCVCGIQSKVHKINNVIIIVCQIFPIQDKLNLLKSMNMPSMFVYMHCYNPINLFLFLTMAIMLITCTLF